MDNFQFISPTEFIFGKDAELSCGKWLTEHDVKRVLIVYGKGHVKKSGLLDRVEKTLADEGISYVELAGIRPNPEISSVRKGVEMYRDEPFDFILAIGGGSVIDAAKAIAQGVFYEGDPWDIYRRPNPVQMAMSLPVGVVLTIPAAGSEASNSSVISNDELGLKTGCNKDHTRPKVAFMNPELTYTLSPWQTAAGITDMCAHIFERFFSSSKPVVSTDEIALALLRSIRSSALKVIRNPNDYDGRANIMWLSTLAHNNLAGLGRNSDWSSHGLEHEMSALKPEVTHGAGLAVIMPAWMRYVYKENPARFSQMGEAMFGLAPTGDAEADALSAIDAFESFLDQLGMPHYMDDFGFVKEDVEHMVEGLKTSRGMKFGSFKEITPDDAQKIYLSAFKNA